MRYIDNGGDLWEDAPDGGVRVVRVSGADVEHAESHDREGAEALWGPFRDYAGDAEADEAPSLPSVDDVMSRADIFQAAHALVVGLKWGEEAPSVYDVLSVAKWLEGEQ